MEHSPRGNPQTPRSRQQRLRRQQPRRQARITICCCTGVRRRHECGEKRRRSRVTGVLVKRFVKKRAHGHYEYAQQHRGAHIGCSLRGAALRQVPEKLAVVTAAESRWAVAVRDVVARGALVGLVCVVAARVLEHGPPVRQRDRVLVQFVRELPRFSVRAGARFNVRSPRVRGCSQASHAVRGLLRVHVLLAVSRRAAPALVAHGGRWAQEKTNDQDQGQRRLRHLYTDD
eukprot:COSAG04_NODE_5461_length_1610_cov_1.327598_2_plen_230_part_00